MTWSLLRIWHVEVLSFVAESPNAHTFERTSYCLAPSTLRPLATPELGARVEQLLEASYRKRNYVSAQSGDATEMWWIAYACEWVAEDTMPAESAEPENIWVRTKMPIHDKLIDDAFRALESRWRQERPGVSAHPWTDGFSAFLIEEDGAGWKLLRSHDTEVDAMFADRLGLPRAS